MTIAAIVDNKTTRNRLFAYFPITFFEDVRYTWIATVKGSWMLRNTCERISPLNGSPIKKIIIKAPTKGNKHSGRGMVVPDIIRFHEHSRDN